MLELIDQRLEFWSWMGMMYPLLFLSIGLASNAEPCVWHFVQAFLRNLLITFFTASVGSTMELFKCVSDLHQLLSVPIGQLKKVIAAGIDYRAIRLVTWRLACGPLLLDFLPISLVEIQNFRTPFPK